MAKRYFTLLEYDNDRNAWYPQFGDYICNVVKQEMIDMAHSNMRPRRYYRIISSGSSGKSVMAAVEAFNINWKA